MHLITDPQTLDWNIATTPMETYLLMNIMEAWSSRRQDESKTSACKVDHHFTGSAYIHFKLRADVKWSDGKPLRAEDFVYSWRRLLDPLTAAPYAYLLSDIEGHRI